MWEQWTCVTYPLLHLTSKLDTVTLQGVTRLPNTLKRVTGNPLFSRQKCHFTRTNSSVRITEHAVSRLTVRCAVWLAAALEYYTVFFSLKCDSNCCTQCKAEPVKYRLSFRPSTVSQVVLAEELTHSSWVIGSKGRQWQRGIKRNCINPQVTLAVGTH